MAKKYVEDLTALITTLNLEGLNDTRLVCKHFFSGAAVYVNGNICITYTPVGLALKLPEESRNELLNNGVRKLRYFPKAPVKKDYVVLPEQMVNNPKLLRKWVAVSIDYVMKD